MPALLKKSFTNSFANKLNSFAGKNNSKVGVDGTPNSPIIIECDDAANETNFAIDGYGYSAQPSMLDILKKNTIAPSPYYEESSGAEVVSDSSSDDDSSGDEDAAEKYGYGDASPDTEPTGTQMPRRLQSRADTGRRRFSSIDRQSPSDWSGNNSSNDENLRPFHPKRKPRRSSLKEGCSVRSQRRASISICQEQKNTIEEDLANGVLSKSQVIEVMLPMRRESIKRRRSIQFEEDVNVRRIQPTTSVKGANKKELWFQDDEYQTIKTKTRALLNKVDSNGIVNGKKYCTRGLEKYMKNPTKREQEKYQAWDSVLMEQEMQRQLQIFDDESMGRFYKRTSIASAAEAHSRATAGAAEVASFYNEKVQTQEPLPPQEISDSEQQQRSEIPRRGRRASIA